jgi:ribose transport system substrate-binding protein
MTRSRRTRVGIAATLTAVALAIAGCGSTSSSSSSAGNGNSSGTSASASSGGSAPGLARARKLLAYWLKGTYEAPPTAGSPKAAAGKHIWVISCGQSLSSCAKGTKGAVDAAHAMGWQASVYDTKGNLATAADGVRQAIAAKASGIFIYFIDCSYMQSALQAAKAAGIPVVQAEGIDCNIADPKAPKLFSWTVSYADGPLLTWLKDFGRAMTSYLIQADQATGNVLYIADNAAIGTKAVVAGYKEEMATCTQCKSTVVPYAFTQIANGLSQPVQEALLRNPNVNEVGVAYDAILNAGVSDAVQQAERTGRKLVLTAGEGQTPTMQLLRSGVVAAGVGLDNEWEGWSGVDALNRIFAGKKPVTSGIGIQLYEKGHNVPASGSYVAPVDFRTAYKMAWGVK